MVDVNLSNGTCYWASLAETVEDYIPCGNVGLGHWPCCQTGDACLSEDNSCFNAKSGNTYVAGCTDKSYSSPYCPTKHGFTDQPWVALFQCDGTTAEGDINWGGCKNAPVNVTSLTVLPLSRCTPYCTASDPLFVGTSSFPAYATLPTVAGGSITWANGFDPATRTGATAVATATTTPTSTSSSTSHSGTPSATAPPAAASSGLDTGAKIGIGIGSAGAAFLAIAVVLLALLVRRRRKRRAQAQNGLQQPPEVSQLPPGFDPQWQAGAGHDSQWPGGAGHKPVDTLPYTGFKHELPADDRDLSTELPASPHQSAVSPNLSTASPHLSTVGADRMSVSNASTLMPGDHGSAGYVSPQSTGSGGYQAAHHGHEYSGPVSEMQG